MVCRIIIHMITTIEIVMSVDVYGDRLAFERA